MDAGGEGARAGRIQGRVPRGTGRNGGGEAPPFRPGPRGEDGGPGIGDGGKAREKAGRT